MLVVSYTRTIVELVEGFRLDILEGEETRGLDCAFERRGSDGDIGSVAHALAHQVGKSSCMEFAAVGEVCVAADLAIEIV